jgi:hypothetical protein
MEEPAGKPVEHVRINYADVIVNGKQDDPEFLKVYWALQDRFSDEHFGYRVCLHEASHAVLMEQDGIKNVRFEKPVVLYRPSDGSFRSLGAMVHGDDTPDTTVDEARFLTLTTHAVAGGIALQEYWGLRPEQTGSEHDYRQFLVACVKAPPGALKTKPDDLWKQAQEIARSRLTDAATKAKVEARAWEYFDLLYL